jgi:pyruvate-formate lyase-activating enzyme
MIFLKIKEIGYTIKIDTNGSYPEKLKELISKKLVDYIARDIKADKEQYLEYHKNYWREHSRIPWTCEYCNKTLQVSDHKKRHWNTKSCISAEEEAAS